MDNLEFASPSQVKSDDLICTILGISAFLSNDFTLVEDSSKIMPLSLISFGKKKFKPFLIIKVCG